MARWHRCTQYAEAQTASVSSVAAGPQVGGALHHHRGPTARSRACVGRVVDRDCKLGRPPPENYNVRMLHEYSKQIV